MPLHGCTFGIVGALAAFPRRLAAREVARQGGVLRRGITRSTTHVVFGRKLIETRDAAEIEALYDGAVAAGRQVLGEGGFLRALRLASTPPNATVSMQSLAEQSRLPERDLKLLALFDGFEHHAEPFSFRDLILARKYAGLLASGANWLAIARSIHRLGRPASLTALSLHVEGPEAIYVRQGARLSELDGQGLLALDTEGEAELEELFAVAEEEEQEGRFAAAAALYRRCLAIDPGDAAAAFNLANCLNEMGEPQEAAHAYALAIKLDPAFVEAWFNLADLLRERGVVGEARRHLTRAIELDPAYADAVYNLAALEYDEENYPEARRWWVRYLELDRDSEWAVRATRGIQFIDLHKARTRKSRA